MGPLLNRQRLEVACLGVTHNRRRRVAAFSVAPRSPLRLGVSLVARLKLDQEEVYLVPQRILQPAGAYSVLRPRSLRMLEEIYLAARIHNSLNSNQQAARYLAPRLRSPSRPVEVCLDLTPTRSNSLPVGSLERRMRQPSLPPVPLVPHQRPHLRKRADYLEAPRLPPTHCSGIKPLPVSLGCRPLVRLQA